MDLVLSGLCMAMCNRVPKGLVAFTTASLANKIKLLSPPRGVEAFEKRTIEKGAPTAENPSGETEVVIPKNTNERAVVRILVPKRTMTLSEYHADQKKEEEEQPAEAKEGQKKEEEEGETKAEGETKESKPGSALSVAKSAASRSNMASRLSRVPSEKIIETDQDDKALAIGNKINLSQQYMVLVMNDYAARQHRHDYIEQLRSKTFDYFQEHKKDLNQL